MSAISDVRAAFGALVAMGKQAEMGQIAGLVTSGPQGAAPPLGGTRELLGAYSTMPWLRAVVSKVGMAAGATTWTISAATTPKAKALRFAGFKLRAEGRSKLQQDELVAIEGHPLIALLESGNEFFPGPTNIALTQQHLDLVGEAFWLKERNGVGMPVAVAPLPPHWVRQTPTRAKPFYEVQARSERKQIPKEDVIYFKIPEPVDPYGRGSGTARALGDELETDEFTAKHVKNFFYNSARPDLIITAEGLQHEDTERLEERWITKNQGIWRSFLPFFMSKKVDVTQIDQSFKNMELISLRKHERDIIVQVFGVPPEVLGIIENSNRATIEAAEFLFTRWVLVPRLEFLRLILQARLVPEFDDRLVLDYVSPVQADKVHQLSVMNGTPYAFTLDEHRAVGGHPELPDGEGDVRLQPINLIPSDGDGEEEPEAVGEKGVVRLRGDQDPGPSPDGPVVIPGLTWMSKPLPLGFNPDDLLTFLDGDGVRIETWSVVQAQQAGLIEAFGVAMIEEVESEAVFVETERVTDFVRRWGLERATKIDRTTKTLLRETLADGVQQGESLTELQSRIEATYKQSRGFRAARIARTETVRSTNFGALEGMVQSGVPKKEWLTSRDQNVRDSHSAMDKQVVARDDFFTSGSGNLTLQPGGFGVAKEDINCRCTILAVFEDQSGFEGEARDARWKTFEADRLPHERAMTRNIKRAFRTQERLLIEHMREMFP